jgi:hypothetical protein
VPTIVLALALAGCGGGDEPRVLAPTTGQVAAAPGEGASFADDDKPLKRFHSARFKLSIPLPDGPAWRIDDHSRPELVATHPPTSSRLTVLGTIEPELMNRQKCEARARALGFAPEDAGDGGARGQRTVEDEVTIGPEAYDTRVWVTIQPGGKPGTALRGHVFAFGAYIRKCLIVHFESEVSTDTQEQILSERLATARLRIVAGIALEPFDEPRREGHGASRSGP